MRGVRHPRGCNVVLDANAVDRDGGPGDALVDRLLGLREAGEINFLVPGSVRTEVQHPNTPHDVKNLVAREIFSWPVGRTAAEHDTLRKVRARLQGNAAPGRHDADAHHLCEASKYRAGYFITHDRRMLNKRDELRPLLGPALCIVTLAEFLDICDEFEARGRRHP
jgi:predicted nucleic acid-binding protein